MFIFILKILLIPAGVLFKYTYFIKISVFGLKITYIKKEKPQD
jgi:hypothetical protein